MISFYQIQNFLKKFSSLILQDKINKIAFFLALFLNLIIWVLLFVKFYPLRKSIVYLHYNIYFGINLIGYWYQTFVIPFLGIFFIIINFILSWFLYLKEKILSYFLNISAAFLQILFLLAVAALAFIN
jgi:hypothetical protein